jgi:hypothetical protein
MSPIQYKLGANHRKKYYHAFKRNKKNRDWLWLFAFWVICVCNGWFLQVYSATSKVSITLLLIFFAIFPVTFIFYALYTRLGERLLANARRRHQVNSVSAERMLTIATLYYQSTYIFRFSLPLSWVLLAFVIGNFNLDLTCVPVTSVLVYGVNIFFLLSY